MEDYYGPESYIEKTMQEAQPDGLAGYIGPMIDSEGRGARMSREVIDGRPANVLREKALRAVGCGHRNERPTEGPIAEYHELTRQEIIKDMAPGTVFHMVREPHNPFDEFAIALFHYKEGRECARFGYIDKHRARKFAADMDQGWSPMGLVEDVKVSARSGEVYVTFFFFEFADGLPNPAPV